MIHKIFKKPTIVKILKKPEIVNLYNFDEDLKNISDEYNVELRTINLLYDIEINTKDKKYNNCKGQQYSIKEIKDIVNSLTINKSSIKMCDLGLGLGKSIFLIAYSIKKLLNIDVEVDGIEINPEYIDMFNKHIKKIWNKYNININVIEKSIDKHKYDDYDIVYFYKPMVDDKKSEDLFSKIEKKLKKETIILKNEKF